MKDRDAGTRPGDAPQFATVASALSTQQQLASALAARLRDAREELVTRWLERISARVEILPGKLFPSEELLNHVPLLIDGIAAYLDRSEDDVGSGLTVVAKAMELGALRHAQGFDAYEILKEHELLSGVVLAFLATVVDDPELPGTRGDTAICFQRVGHAVDQIRQATMTHFLRLSAERAHEREERLRRFNRMVSHELKNRVGVIRGAATMLGEGWLDAAQRDRFIRMTVENADGLQRVIQNLEALSRIEADTRQRRNVLLPQTATEVVRQLRASAAAKGVSVRIAPGLPAVEVDAAAVELCLMNYVSNAIKYSDPDKAERWIEITGEYRPSTIGTGDADAGAELVIHVRDNGRNVPESARARLFEQFFRAHAETVTGIEGTGLGLSIVRETAESLGGRAWAEFPEDGTTIFAFALPSRREEDAAAAGTRRPDGGTF